MNTARLPDLKISVAIDKDGTCLYLLDCPDVICLRKKQTEHVIAELQRLLPQLKDET